jgi:8-oxo-dGTP pyrophosphatase MutT (NUDIX family)
MTELTIGVVDVLVFRGTPAGGEVLVLRRAAGTRCTGAWEVVHGRIEPGERPEDAALREVREETGLAVDRLYNLTCQPFYLNRFATVQLAVRPPAIRRTTPSCNTTNHTCGSVGCCRS